LIGLHLPDLFCAERLLGTELDFSARCVHCLNLLRDLVERGLQPLRRQVRQELLCRRAGDEIYLAFSNAVRVVSLRVVPVKVGVHHVTHRKCSDLRLDLGDERCRGRGLGVRIYNHHIARVHEDYGVRIDLSLSPSQRQRALNSVGNLLDVE